MKNTQNLVQRVTDYFGSAYKAAKALGVSHQQYYFWQKQNKFPFKRGKDIEKATNGDISAIEVWEDAGRRK